MPPSSIPQKLHRFEHDPAWEGKRLKEVLRLVLPDLGSRGALLVITNGLVSSADEAEPWINADFIVPTGSPVTVDLRHGLHGQGKSKHPHLHERMNVRHDDDHVVVVAKRPFMLVQPSDEPENDKGTRAVPLVELLKHYWKAKGDRGTNPILVQRLDFETSGLLVIAKNVEASRQLQLQLRPPRRLKRDYLAIVAGTFTEQKGTWKSYMGYGKGNIRQSLAEGSRTAPSSSKVQYAETRYKVEKVFENATLLRLQLETGRTHQIRIHCAEAGHPVLGDDHYLRLAENVLDRVAKGKLKPRGEDSPWKEALALVRLGQLTVAQPAKLPRRIALHATRLSFVHPATNERMTFEEPLPAELEDYMKGLGKWKPAKKEEDEVVEKAEEKKGKDGKRGKKRDEGEGMRDEKGKGGKGGKGRDEGEGSREEKKGRVAVKRGEGGGARRAKKELGEGEAKAKRIVKRPKR